MAQHSILLRLHTQLTATTLTVSCSLWFLPEKGSERESVAEFKKLQRQRNHKGHKRIPCP